MSSNFLRIKQIARTRKQSTSFDEQRKRSRFHKNDLRMLRMSTACHCSQCSAGDGGRGAGHQRTGRKHRVRRRMIPSKGLPAAVRSSPDLHGSICRSVSIHSEIRRFMRPCFIIIRFNFSNSVSRCIRNVPKRRIPSDRKKIHKKRARSGLR